MDAVVPKGSLAFVLFKELDKTSKRTRSFNLLKVLPVTEGKGSGLKSEYGPMRVGKDSPE